MKNLKISVLTLIIATSLLSCDNRKRHDAERDVKEFSNYVDSVSIVSIENLNENWGKIEKIYTEKKLQAQSSVEALGDAPELNEKINKADSKYKDFKENYEFESEKFKISN